MPTMAAAVAATADAAADEAALLPPSAEGAVIGLSARGAVVGGLAGGVVVVGEGSLTTAVEVMSEPLYNPARPLSVLSSLWVHKGSVVRNGMQPCAKQRRAPRWWQI